MRTILSELFEVEGKTYVYNKCNPREVYEVIDNENVLVENPDKILTEIFSPPMKELMHNILVVHALSSNRENPYAKYVPEFAFVTPEPEDTGLPIFTFFNNKFNQLVIENSEKEPASEELIAALGQLYLVPVKFLKKYIYETLSQKKISLEQLEKS